MLSALVPLTPGPSPAGRGEKGVSLLSPRENIQVSGPET